MRFGKHADPSTVISIAKRSFVPHVCRNAIKEKKTKQCLYLILDCSTYIWSVSWDWGTPRPLLVICQIWLIFKFNNMGFGQSLPFFIAHPFPPFYLSSYLSIYPTKTKYPDHHIYQTWWKMRTNLLGHLYLFVKYLISYYIIPNLFSIICWGN